MKYSEENDLKIRTVIFRIFSLMLGLLGKHSSLEITRVN